MIYLFTLSLLTIQFKVPVLFHLNGIQSMIVYTAV